MDEQAIRIAVVGAGPRGSSLVERLIANHQVVQGARVEILLFDPSPAGSGRIWTGEQPHHLLMNTLCADATHFTDDTINCQGPIVPGPTLYEWASGLVDTPDQHEADLLAEAATLRPWSHPSRKLLGRYLEWCHQQDLLRLPATMEFTYVAEEVLSVRARPQEPGDSGSDVKMYVLQTGASTHHVDAVILATGHSDLQPGIRQVQLTEHARRHDLFYGPPANPIDQDLSDIGPGDKLAVRGLGMNFFDYMSLLTTGRGGRYRATDDGGLRYEPSGEEPVLIAGSRRGVPYRAKGAFGSMTPTFERRYLSDNHLAHLASIGRQLDFMEDLWPHIAKDTLWTYYSILATTKPEAFVTNVDELAFALDHHEWADPDLHRAIERVVPRAADRLDLDRLDRPLKGQVFASHRDLTTWWRADLAQDYGESQLGYASALKCASVALGAGRAPIRTLARYGGFTGTSFTHHIEGWFRGFGGALASGPPAQRILELIALVDAGIVLPAGPDMQVVAREGRFVVSSPALPGTELECDGLLEAHLPPAHATRSSSRLTQQLLHDGHARPFTIPDPQLGGVTSGALEVGPEPYRLVNEQGEEQSGLFALGVPLESIHWGTQLGPLAETNSRFLRETDAVARAALLDGKARRDRQPATHAIAEASHR